MMSVRYPFAGLYAINRLAWWVDTNVLEKVSGHV
jgi:hypothetical protein